MRQIILLSCLNSLNGDDMGCSYVELYCKTCRHNLGRSYKATTTVWDPFNIYRDAFALKFEELEIKFNSLNGYKEDENNNNFERRINMLEILMQHNQRVNNSSLETLNESLILCVQLHNKLAMLESKFVKNKM